EREASEAKISSIHFATIAAFGRHEGSRPTPRSEPAWTKIPPVNFLNAGAKFINSRPARIDVKLSP
ncbi:MAG TPA: hypothetical protein VED19_01275, partial [Candidatus Nitrosopolaris sp.]|nr:hypothetical protein [Candidatus Nitrosopolaris sp.]